ncbi:MAG: sigma-70 family RNA polymerase sigma factor [Chitinophagales bacterium]
MEEKSIKYYLQGISEKDEAVIQEIYALYFNKVVGYVMKNSGDKSDAKDVFNKAIMQLMVRKNLDTIKDTSTFEAYLFTACRNLWLRKLSKIKKNKRVTNDHVTELYYKEKDMAQSTLEQERWELFNEQFKNLSDNCKKVLQMLFDKISGKDIQEKVGLWFRYRSRQRVFKCKKKLSELVQSDERFKTLLYK